MKRYPLGPLLDLMGMSQNQACAALGLSGSTQQEYRRDGVTERVADRLAVKAGFLPYEVWPEIADDAIASVEVPCARHDCDGRFVPARCDQLRCSPRCAAIIRQRRLRARPEGAERARQSAARYRAENPDYERSRRRRRYAAKRAAGVHWSKC